MGSGSSKLAFVAAPERQGVAHGGSESVEQNSHHQVLEAHAIGSLALPAYPVSALVAKAGRAVVAMRIIVGTDGTVTSVQRRSGFFAFSIPHYEDFDRAIRESVERWRFSPARVIDGDVNPDTGVGTVNEQLIEMSFDVDFVFDD